MASSVVARLMASANLSLSKISAFPVCHGVLKAARWLGVLMLVLAVGLPVTIYSRLTGDKTPWAPYEGD